MDAEDVPYLFIKFNDLINICFNPCETENLFHYQVYRPVYGRATPGRPARTNGESSGYTLSIPLINKGDWSNKYRT